MKFSRYHRISDLELLHRDKLFLKWSIIPYLFDLELRFSEALAIIPNTGALLPFMSVDDECMEINVER